MRGHIDVESNPLEFDPFSEVYFTDPYDTYRRLRDEAPVYHNAAQGFWALSRYTDVAASIKDSGTFSSAHGVTLDMVLNPEVALPSGPMIIMMDPPEHTRMRRLVNKAFTARAVAGMESMVKAVIDSHLERLDPESFDAVADFSDLFPFDVIATMLGVPEEHREQIRGWLAKPLERAAGDAAFSTEAVDGVRAAARLYMELIAQRRRTPRDDMITRLTQAEIDRGDGVPTRLTDLEIAGFISLLGGAGAETVAKLIGNAMVLFAEHPEQWRALRADRGLVPGAFEELLRYQPPAQYDVRVTTRDVTMHGVTIPEGSPVLLLLAAATRDDREFADADRFDITRRYSSHNLGFGYGIHSCLGAALARMEGALALNALLDLMPEYTVDRAGLRRVSAASVAGWCNVPVRRISAP
ncbi:cytochrome P450 [Nocardia sp. NPDC055321]